MKMWRAKSGYPAPDIGHIESAWVDLGEKEMCGVRWQLMLVRLEQMMEWRADGKMALVLGRPCYVAHDPVKRMFLLYPDPGESGEFGVRFYPPLVEV